MGLKEYLKVARVDEITRRYFVMNGFDGALATLGIIVGAYFAGVMDTKMVLFAGLGASLAMGISGAWGAYMAERAERTRNIKELERAMFTSLEGSIIERASNVAMVVVALVGALSPVYTSLISLSPFIFSLMGMLPATSAVFAAFVLNMATLFSLGVFLGKVSRTSVWLHGILMVAAGLLIILIMSLIGALH